MVLVVVFGNIISVIVMVRVFLVMVLGKIALIIIPCKNGISYRSG